MEGKLTKWCGLFLTLFVLSFAQDDYIAPSTRYLQIYSDIKFRFATTVIESHIVNTANYSTDTRFDVILPEEAFISNFTLEIEGVIYPGIVKDKDEAKKDYEKAKKKGKTTGLVSQKARETRKFKVDVNIAPQSTIIFKLTYQELLERVKGVYELKIYVTPQYPVEDLQVAVSILESRPITRLDTPAMKDVYAPLSSDDGVNSLAVISRPTRNRAEVIYKPTFTDQGHGLNDLFTVKYDIDRSMDGGDLLVVNGYFVHFLAPDISSYIPKDVMFILDTSGSMSGIKLSQLKDAMYVILDELQEGDRFNIMLFNSDSNTYKPGMIDATKNSVFEAKKYVKRIKASGWTNINGAVLDGISKLIASAEEGERSPVIIFLTDGEATGGVTDNKQILKNVVKANEGELPIFSLAFGSDADWNLVKTMSLQNNGVGRKIYEDSDAALQISGFYDELAVTLLNNVSVSYLGDIIEDDSVTQSDFKSYFQGSEMVVAGKLVDTGIDVSNFNLKIIGDSVDGALILTGNDNTNIIDLERSYDADLDIEDFYEITEKTWAYLTIKQLLKRAEGEDNTTIIDDLKARAKELALKNGFVTPLTSMVVVKPDVDEDSDVEYRPKPKPTTTTTTQRPRRYYGGGGGWGGGGGGDPHYMIRVENISNPICFDVPSKPDEIHNLITDPVTKIKIRTRIISSSKLDKTGLPKTFIGQVSVQMKHHVIVITPEAIFYNEKIFLWSNEKVKHFGAHKLMTTEHGRLLSITFGFGAEVLIRRHVHRNHSNDDVNYLNIYVKHEDGFSKKSVGLIGQFVNGHKQIHLLKQFISEGGETIAKLQVREGKRFKEQTNIGEDKDVFRTHQRIRAKLIDRPEVVDNDIVKCWMVHEQFVDVLHGPSSFFMASDFIDSE
ncbi:Inter-alpha-trypsin inhibitor heavy chain [Mactra antiquata]